MHIPNQIPPKKLLVFQKSALMEKYNVSQNRFRDFEQNKSDLLSSLNEEYGKRFRQSKPFKDENIAGEIFRTEFKCKDSYINWLKFNLYASSKTAERICNGLELLQKTTMTSGNQLNPKIENCIEFLNDFVLDYISTLDEYDSLMKGSRISSGYGKRNVLNTMDVLQAIKALLYNEQDRLDSFIRIPLSVLVIRQYIELRLKNAIGVTMIIEKNGSIFKHGGQAIIDWYKKYKKDITLPIGIALISKIYRWANLYVHIGLIPKIWQIEWAEYILQALSKPYDVKTVVRGKVKHVDFNAFGAIQIPKSLIENIQTDMQTILYKKFERSFIIDTYNTPECRKI